MTGMPTLTASVISAPGRRRSRKRPWVLATAGTALLAVTALLALVPGADAWAQQVTIDIGGEGGGSTTGRIVQLVGLLTVLSVAPGLLVMVTSFTRIVVVFAVLRHALATQTAPPNMVLVSLAMFMTFFIMAPTLEQAWDEGLRPLIDEQIDEMEAFERTAQPFRRFMLSHVRAKDLELFMTFNNETAPEPEQVSLQALVPAFMISELRRAFEIGFLIYLPFVVIDMVIASVLMSMGMMMLPPMMLAMPFKLIFFVLVDGWYLLVGSLMQSFGPLGGG